MPAWFLYVAIPILLLLLLAGNVGLMVHYLTPEEAAWRKCIGFKIVLVTSLLCVYFVQLLIPLDVQDVRNPMDGLNMRAFWVTMLLVVFCALVCFLPIAIALAEDAGEPCRKKVLHALCTVGVTLAVVFALLGVGYPFLSVTYLTQTVFRCDGWTAGDASVVDPGISRLCHHDGMMDLVLYVGFDVYIIGVMTIVGWLFFASFCGIGLIALPVDLIVGFVDRPRSMDEAAYKQRRTLYSQVTRRLLERATELKELESAVSSRSRCVTCRRRQALKSQYNKFQRDVVLLEAEMEKLAISKSLRGENLAVSIAKLILGIFCAIFTLMLIVQIIISMINHFAATNLIFLEGIFLGLTGTSMDLIAFAGFSAYFIICTVKGCVKFGMRVLLCFSIHPMRVRATPMNSFLFNVELLLLTSAPAVDFAVSSYPYYTRYTAVNALFGTQIRNMRVLGFCSKYFVFEFVLLFFSFATSIILALLPRDSNELNPGKGSMSKMVAIAAAHKSRTNSEVSGDLSGEDKA